MSIWEMRAARRFFIAAFPLDEHGHLIVDHDLPNYNGELPGSTAEAFTEWAKDEKFEFLELSDG